MRIALAPVVLAWLCCGCRTVAPPSDLPKPIDVLDYLVGNASLWPRSGTAYINQATDFTKQEVCWVKYGNPRSFECWRWDDQFIYHVVDHAIDGNTGESYHFTDGRWMPRYLMGEWSLDVSNRIVWFDSGCQVEAERSGPFIYHQRVWHEDALDIGGDLGTRDRIVLEYAPEDPAGGPTVAEHFYFARGAGWYSWDRVGVKQTMFNRVGGYASIPVARGAACGQ